MPVPVKGDIKRFMNNSKTNDQVSQYSNGRRFQTVPNTHEDTRLYFDPSANGNPFGYTDSRVRDPSDGYEVDNTSYISSHHYSSFPDAYQPGSYEDYRRPHFSGDDLVFSPLPAYDSFADTVDGSVGSYAPLVYSGEYVYAPESNYQSNSCPAGYASWSVYSDHSSESAQTLPYSISYNSNVPETDFIMSPPSDVQQPLYTRRFNTRRPRSSRKPDTSHVFSVKSNAVARLCCNRGKCLELQEELEISGASIVDSICEDLGDDLQFLLPHKYGNYLFQKLISVATDEQKRRIITSTKGMLVSAAMTAQGTRSVQALIMHCRQEDMLESIIDSIAPSTNELSQDVNGNHVIAQLLDIKLDSVRKPLLEEIVKHCIELCKSKYGCSVINKCVNTMNDSDYRSKLIQQIENDAVEIVQHEYGNYVVQYLIKTSPPAEVRKYCQFVLGNVCMLSTDMCSSNVVELSIQFGDEETRQRIIDEMLQPDSFPKILQNRFGKYVIQKALVMTTGVLKARLIKAIRNSDQNSRAFPLDMHLLTKINDVGKY